MEGIMTYIQHMENTGTHFLGAGEWNLCADTARSFTFGHIVKCVTPHVKRYHSDLFHDARWISTYLIDNPTHEPFTFYVAVGPHACGTHIGTDEALIAGHADHMWRFTVRDGNAGTTKYTGKWVLDITKRTSEGDYTLVLEAVTAG